MDIVHCFNDELSSLLRTKPPVSKAKMCTITKAAMKGVKFYKHIVQIVEKFIARCRPEYKVPGLYVIDSIVRQSRHQFGPDRDVYAARFARNLGITFENLFSDCLDEDRARIVRVLNLWLKNGVFDGQTIRPLLDMADSFNNSTNTFQRDPRSPSSGETNSSATKQDHHHYSSSSINQRYPTNMSASDNNTLKFSKNMLDFDYGEDDDEDADETPTEAEPPLSSTLSKIEMEQQRVKNTVNDSSHSSHTPRKTSITDANGNQSGQSAQTTATPKQQAPPNQDPVLERWNKIIKGELTNDSPRSSSISSQQQARRRSRSRSPSLGKATGLSERLPAQYSSQAQQHFNTTDPYQSGSKNGNNSDLQSQTSSGQQSAINLNPEKVAERERRCLPPIRDKHLTVCSSTLWLGHVPKMVSEADISDAFGEFGTINSIDLIPPRGCAFVCMDRRQDAKRSLSQSKRIKLNGSHIRMAWAPGKGLKEQKNWKDFWNPDVGASYVPYAKIDLDCVDFDQLEEGGVIDEDSMSLEMIQRRDSKNVPPKREATKLSSDAKGQTASDKTTTSSSYNQSEVHNASSMPIFNQPPPSGMAGLQSTFVVPPPPLNLGIPPPMLVSQGALLPFPPPHTSLALGPTTNSTTPLPVANPQHTMLASMAQQAPATTIGSQQSDMFEARDKQTRPPASNLAPSERKINMVEQQLNMIQQSAPNVNQAHLTAAPESCDGAGALFYQPNQPDPAVFDFLNQPPQMLHMASLLNPNGASNNMLDPNQQAIFDVYSQQPSNQMLVGPPLLLPFAAGQPSALGPSGMGGDYLTQQHGGNF